MIIPRPKLRLYSQDDWLSEVTSENNRSALDSFLWIEGTPSAINLMYLRRPQQTLDYQASTAMQPPNSCKTVLSLRLSCLPFKSGEKTSKECSRNLILHAGHGGSLAGLSGRCLLTTGRNKSGAIAASGAGLSSGTIGLWWRAVIGGYNRGWGVVHVLDCACAVRAGVWVGQDGGSRCLPKKLRYTRFHLFWLHSLTLPLSPSHSLPPTQVIIPSIFSLPFHR